MVSLKSITSPFIIKTIQNITFLVSMEFVPQRCTALYKRFGNKEAKILWLCGVCYLYNCLVHLVGGECSHLF